ncbi:MAG: hypothetical protein JKY43_00045 [Phycisphaerales bacterium]|nr:hypothetical protein [Phycisphaerales bacterium]
MPKPPQRKTEWKDQYTLLCESCGYILENLNHSLPCPECGKPIQESLPQRRTGTPIQHWYTSKNARKTWWMTLRHPFKMLDIMRFNLNDHEDIASTNIIIALAAPALILLAFTALDSIISVLLLFFGYIFLLPLAWGFLLLMTTTDSFIIRFFGNRKGFRISHAISNNIVAHGSVGWIIAGLGSSIGILFIFAPYIITVRIFDMYETTQHNQILQNLKSFGSWLIPISILGGILFFESFAYLGIRRCKYANTLRPKSTPESTLPNEPRP